MVVIWETTCIFQVWLYLSLSLTQWIPKSENRLSQFIIFTCFDVAAKFIITFVDWLEIWWKIHDLKSNIFKFVIWNVSLLFSYLLENGCQFDINIDRLWFVELIYFWIMVKYTNIRLRLETPQVPPEQGWVSESSGLVSYHANLVEVFTSFMYLCDWKIALENSNTVWQKRSRHTEANSNWNSCSRKKRKSIGFGAICWRNVRCGKRESVCGKLSRTAGAWTLPQAGRMLCCVEMFTTRQQCLLSCYDSLRNVNLVTEKAEVFKRTGSARTDFKNYLLWGS